MSAPRAAGSCVTSCTYNGAAARHAARHAHIYNIMHGRQHSALGPYAQLASNNAVVAMTMAEDRPLANLDTHPRISAAVQRGDRSRPRGPFTAASNRDPLQES